METLRCTAAALAAAALFEVLPGSHLLGGGPTPTGFFYQVNSLISPVPETLQMLEERMRQIVRERRPLRALEMVAASAQGLFSKQGHLAALEALQECSSKELLSVIQIGEFYDLLEGPFCSSLQELAAFKLLSLEKVGDQEYRLEGCVAPSKDELKALLRRRAKYAEENHRMLGEELGLWEGNFVWRKRGLRVKRALLAHLTQRCIGEEIALSDAQQPIHFTHWSYSDRTVALSEDSGLLAEECQSTIEQKIESGSRADANSLLQTAHELLTMLGFHPEVREGQLLVEDGLGRLHEAATVVVSQGAVKATMGLERILALLLERSAGNLPKWLIPEHVRLLPLEERHLPKAREFAHSIEAAGHRAGIVDSQESLKHKLSAAKRERVPFVLVIGDRELELGKATLRRPTEETGELVDLRELIERLNEN